MMRSRLLILFSLVLGPTPIAADEAVTAEQIEFFESKVRPLLVERCYKCHGPDEQEANLRLDSRVTTLAGGDTGPAVVPGDADGSELIRAVRYEPDGYQMPPDGKLPDNEIATLVRWVEMGAPWPNGEAPVESGSEAFNLAERANRWSFLPLTRPPIPDVSNADWYRNPIDRFILHKLEQNGLTPSPSAAPPTLLRRASFDVVGLPPSPVQVERFTADSSPPAYEQLVDELLASPHFGERWGRHWLDLVRYAESRGHEFDHNVANAFQYRDYIIRALNDDVPYDQLVVEHIAGDLLPSDKVARHTTRLHPFTGGNESIVATGFWFLGEWVHSPVDIRADEAERFANMIDVYSKTFLGLTVACARCHDHKFDPITTKDYYALQGYLQSSHYRQARFETMEHNRRVAEQLTVLRREATSSEPAQPPAAENAGLSHERLLAEGFDPSTVEMANPPSELTSDGVGFRFRMSRIDGGVAANDAPAAPSIFLESDSFWDALASVSTTIPEPGATAGWDRSRTVRTPSFEIKSGRLYALVRGGTNTYVAVDSHMLIAGPLHGTVVKQHPDDPNWHWIEHDVSRYAGHRAHLEFVPHADKPLAIADVVQSSAPPHPLFVSTSASETAAQTSLDAGHEPSTGESLDPDQLAELGRQIRSVSAMTPAMIDGSGEDEYVFVRGNWKKRGDVVPRRFLEVFGGGEMPRPVDGSGRLELAEWMVDPAKTPILPRVMVNRIWQHYFGQGIVPTPDDFGYMGQEPTHPELLDWLACELVDSGWSLKHIHRLILTSAAYQMATEAAPSVVRGPSSVDAHGEQSESQLTTDHGQRTFPDPNDVDPSNRLLHRMNLKRLEGEVIRDAILSLSGRLDDQQYGPSVPVHLTPFMEGRGLPSESGPVDGNGRRSVYLAVRRNFPEPFFQAFDLPNPHSTVGRRNVSNVPAQALAMMNNPLVVEQSRLWAVRLLASPDLPNDDARITAAYIAAFARPPSGGELNTASEFLSTHAQEPGTEVTDVQLWQDFCHVLLNAKEFLFVR